MQTWQETTIACDHTRSLQQDEVSGYAARSQLQQCHQCDKKENLWLCLTCGYVGCGRRQFDGSGGNGHAADHFSSSNHAVSLKLGTITADGNADIFCYSCDEMRIDPDLIKHLALFSININAAEKTEKSMAELQLEQNIKYDFSMATEDGKEFEPAEMVGFKNLGNSCYIASTLQSCLSLPEFHDYFNTENHFENCKKDPWNCFNCQMIKVINGCQSKSEGAISPWMLKSVVASGNSEFSSGQQQDAAEFLQHLFKVIERNDPQSKILKSFAMDIQQSIGCNKCGNCRVQTQRDTTTFQVNVGACVMKSSDPLDPKLSLIECLNDSFAASEIELNCGKCDSKVSNKEQYLTSTPEILILTLSRYIVENWVPRKLEVPVGIPLEGLDLSKYISEAKADTKDEPLAKAIEVDEMSLQQLISMGFSEGKSRKALHETGNLGPDLAMDWLIGHMDDPEPEESNAEVKSDSIPKEALEMLMTAGFSEEASIQALVATNLDVERAFDYALSHPVDEPAPILKEKSSHLPIYDLTAFISHKGSSMHCGHYVAYVKESGSSSRWILFNDSKVAYMPDTESVREAASLAYIYFFKRR